MFVSLCNLTLEGSILKSNKLGIQFSYRYSLNQLGRLGDAAPGAVIVLLLLCQRVHVDHLGIVSQ